jgi:hypothetical protein
VTAGHARERDRAVNTFRHCAVIFPFPQVARRQAEAAKEERIRQVDAELKKKKKSKKKDKKKKKGHGKKKKKSKKKSSSSSSSSSSESASSSSGSEKSSSEAATLLASLEAWVTS